MRKHTFIFLLPGVLLLAFLVYLPGLSGDFLFDDHPNLEKLGTFAGIKNLENLYSYLKTANAGPTGRPIALLSFLINDTSWPSDPYSFKYTNVLLHLLVGLLILWASLRLLRQIGWRESDAILVALLATALWLLHPYFVSTTLYVVQRMAQLAALFALTAIIGYLHGRSMLALRPRTGLAWMTVSVTLGTLLATLSKENGALVPTLILVMEWSLARHWITAGPKIWWRIPFLWLPTLAVLAYLARPLMGEGLLPHRLFNLEERLLTQPRILWEYLQYLFFPRMQTRGLYQDGYAFSTSLLVPWTTLAAIMTLAGLVAIAIWARRRYPLVSLGVLFFLAGHLTESTTIGLELYFEHRNYLPAAFLFLPLAAGIVSLRNKLSPALWTALAIAPILVVALTTFQRATLWGNTPQMLSVWAHSAPESPRANSSIAQALFNEGQVPESIDHLRQASTRIPSSALLSVRLLIHQVSTGGATMEDFERAIDLAKQQRFDAQAVGALRLLVEVMTENPETSSEHYEAATTLLDAYLQNPEYGNFALVRRFAPYLRMQIHLANGEIRHAIEMGLLTIRNYKDTDTALSIVAEIAAAGFPKEALDLMDEAREIFAHQPTRTLKRPSAVYEREIKRLTQVLKEDIQEKMESEPKSGAPHWLEPPSPLRQPSIEYGSTKRRDTHVGCAMG